jgi:hypothetical protein
MKGRHLNESTFKAKTAERKGATRLPESKDKSGHGGMNRGS